MLYPIDLWRDLDYQFQFDCDGEIALTNINGDNNYILQQYTNMKDKLGTEIYDGVHESMWEG